jgi:hypothetical protein
MHLRHVVKVRALFVAVFFSAPAWPAEVTVERHPSDPTAPLTTIEYRSVFADYQSPVDAERKSWGAANEAAGSAGDHVRRAVPRASRADDSQPGVEKRPAPTSPGGAGHSGH